MPRMLKPPEREEVFSMVAITIEDLFFFSSYTKIPFWITMAGEDLIFQYDPEESVVKMRLGDLKIVARYKGYGSLYFLDTNTTDWKMDLVMYTYPVETEKDPWLGAMLGDHHCPLKSVVDSFWNFCIWNKGQFIPLSGSLHIDDVGVFRVMTKGNFTCTWRIEFW